MQRVIILDGPDGCGKTNIAKAIAKKYRAPYFKNECELPRFATDPDYFRNAMKYGDPYFASYLKQTGASVTLDRSFPSEYVYSLVFDRESDLNVLREVDLFYQAVGARIIIPYRSDYSMVDDQLDAITVEKLQQLHKVYTEDFVKWTACPVTLLCVDDEDLVREMTELEPFIRCCDTEEEWDIWQKSFIKGFAHGESGHKLEELSESYVEGYKEGRILFMKRATWS